MSIVYFDSETVGLCGGAKLFQFSVDEGPVQFIKLFRGWESHAETRQKLHQFFDLIDNPSVTICIFNASFDWFKIYITKHRLLGEEYDSPRRPVKPFACKTLDLQIPAMLRSPLAPFAFNRAGNRSVALLRRIPTAAVEIVADRVTSALKPLLPQSFELGVGLHKVPKHKELTTLSFNVKGRLSLKGLMQEYGIPTLKLADVWPLPNREDEKPWLPYPDPVVHDPIEAQCDQILRGPRDSGFFRYSELDILYLKVLYEKLGQPEPDYNSDNVHNMAYLRYYGFDIDRYALDRAESYYGFKVDQIERTLAGVNLRSSTDRLRFLQPHFPLLASTNKRVLTALSKLEGEGARLASMILEYGPARQRLLQIQKVRECRTGRAHPSLRVMGTATNRMAGEAGLNWQGIGAAVELDEPEEPVEELEQVLAENEELGEAKKEKVGLRSAILTPCVGDWASFEVVIAASVYNDPRLKADLQAGVDLHSMTVATAHPKAIAEGLTYDQIRAAYKADDARITGWRKQMKAIVFGIFYFASSMKVAEVLEVADQEGQAVLNRFYDRYKSIGQYRQAIEGRFITADVDRWTKGCIQDMDTVQTDLTGFSRHWDFEKSVACALWELGHQRIKTGLPGEVVRSIEKGKQTIDMAITSACLGSAIAIQAAVSRQAGNMPVQATGASLTKMLAAKLWNELRVPTLSVHDELLPPHHPNYRASTYAKAIDEFVCAAQDLVPMVKFDYKETVRWSDK